MSEVYRQATATKALPETPREENQHVPVFVSVQILPVLAASRQTVCPFTLRVKSLVSCIEDKFLMSRTPAPLGSSQVPSGSGELDQVELGRTSIAMACPHIHEELSSFHMDLTTPADSWERDWDPSSAKGQQWDREDEDSHFQLKRDTLQTLCKLC